jgi:hypothetical protein
MRVRAFIGVFACAASAAVAVPISAGAQTHTDCATFDSNGNIVNVVPNCSETDTTGAQPPQSQPSLNPCNGDTGMLTMTVTRSIFHVNVNGAGDLWVTGTSEGTITFTPDDSSEPSASGHTTMWFGGSLNNRNAAFTDTFAATLRTTDGHTVTVHGVDHTTISGTGTVTSTFSFGNDPTCH